VLGAELERLFAQEAKARQITGKGIDGSGGRGHKRNLMANLPQGLLNKARQQAGGGDKKSGVANLQHPIEHQGRAREQAAQAVNVRVELALRLEPLIAAKAKEKQRESGGAVCQKSDKPVIDTKKEVAKAAGVSHDTIAKAKERQREHGGTAPGKSNTCGKFSTSEALTGRGRQDAIETPGCGKGCGKSCGPGFQNRRLSIS